MGAYSKLHNYTVRKIRNSFRNLQIIENYHPHWLLSPAGTRLEIDIFLPEIKIAIEIQGVQHFKFIEFFHKSYTDFEKRKIYDNEKRNLCHGAGIKLVEICTESDAIAFVDELKYILTDRKEPSLTKLQRNAISAIERKDKTMADALCRKCLKQYQQGKEKKLHSTIKKYLGLV